MAELAIDAMALQPARTTREKQELVLLAICVAGKTAHVQQEKLRQLLAIAPEGHNGKRLNTLPYTRIRKLYEAGQLMSALRRVKMGQYRRICQAMAWATAWPVHKLNIKKLESIPGIGPKTARFIMMYLDPTIRCAVLDTHVLAWLRDLDYLAPKITPPAGYSYDAWEEIYLKECDLRGKTPIEMDQEIWRERARKESVHV